MTLEGRPGAPRPDRSAAIRRAVTLFGHTVTAPPVPVASSVLNENFRVETSEGPRFARVVRQARTPEHLLQEWRALLWAQSRDVPVCLPELSGGSPFVRAGLLLIQLYPWIDGREAWPEPDDAFTAGEMHGRLHGALAYFSREGLSAGGTGATWDTAESIAALSRVDDLIRYYPSPGQERLRAQEMLRYRLELLESSAARPASDFDALPISPCHGDFHRRNLLLDAGGEVAAVVDWELVGLLPPLFELVRAVCFSDMLEDRLLRPYVRGYRQHHAIDPAEAHLAVEMWWQSFLHNTWAFRMRFIRGDDRVDRFFEPDHALLQRLASPSYRLWLVDELTRDIAFR